jgi:hypothetical protein
MSSPDWSDIERLKILKAQYCRFADTKQWDKYFDLFADDFSFEVSAGAVFDADGAGERFGDSGRQQGRANFSDWVRRTAAPIEVSVHHCHLPEIEILDVDRAKAIWALEDRLYFLPEHPHRSFHGFGHYHETYQRINGEWKFQTLQLLRTKAWVHPW